MPPERRHRRPRPARALGHRAEPDAHEQVRPQRRDDARRGRWPRPAGASSRASGSQPWSGTSGRGHGDRDEEQHPDHARRTARRGWAPRAANDVRASSGMESVCGDGRAVDEERRDPRRATARRTREHGAPSRARRRPPSLAAAWSARGPPQPPTSMTSADQHELPRREQRREVERDEHAHDARTRAAPSAE